MTAIAVDYRADRAVLASDSAIYDDAGTHVGYGSKIYSFPAQRCAFFARGRSDISLRTVQQVLIRPVLHTWEDVAAALPQFITDAARDFYKGAGLEYPAESPQNWGESRPGPGPGPGQGKPYALSVQMGSFMIVCSSPRYIRAEREATLKNGRGACRLRRSFSKRRVDAPGVMTRINQTFGAISAT
jgi:hypothetical protein